MKQSRKTVLTNWLGRGAVQEARQLCARSGIPTYVSPERTAMAFAQMVAYRRNQETLIQTPESVPGRLLVPDLAAARRSINAGARGRSRMAQRARGQAGAAGLRHRGGRDAHRRRRGGGRCGGTRRSATRWCSRSSRPTSPTSPTSAVSRSTCKAGGQGARRGRAILQRVRDLRPEARVDGFTVQRMVRRPFAHELIVGAVGRPGVRPDHPVRPGRHGGRSAAATVRWRCRR